MKIVVDTCGGDNGCFEIVKGALRGLGEYNDLNIIFTGHKEQIEKALKDLKYNDLTKIEIVDCQEEITNQDVPTDAIKTKKDSSLVKAFDILKQNTEVIGLISTGSTGAVLTGAFLKIGRIHGISRPCLSPLLPTMIGGRVLLVDAGANVDCKPINICHFALLGSVYLKSVYGVENPTVALLNIGVEDKKGNEFTKECFNELSKMKNINFVGNMEARDFMSGKYDIVVADGFYGNILLKSTEGAIMFAMKTVKKNIKASSSAKFGYLFMGKAFKGIKNTLNYNNYGGSPFLGIKKLVVKSHGSSDALAIFRSIENVVKMHQNGFVAKIEDSLRETENE